MKNAVILLFGLFAGFGTPCRAHVSERGLVLLLPTDIYIFFGTLAVLLTVFLTVLVPPRFFNAVFADKFPTQTETKNQPFKTAISTLAFGVFACLIWLGLYGPRDPLANLLPLGLLTLWWICLPVIQAIGGDFWSWINPWHGPVSLAFRGRARFDLPARLGVTPALLTYVAAGVYALTDIAPDDPARLAWLAASYWIFTFALCGLFGPVWLSRGEGFTVFLTLIAHLSPIRWRPFRLDFPGQAIIGSDKASVGFALFVTTALALGSFDGLNETFWWMARIGINPLEFPGRSAVIWPNRAGLLIAIFLVAGVFIAAVWAGLALVSKTSAFVSLFGKIGLTLLPIALGYHIAHFLTSAMVNLQYVPLVLNDPLNNGAKLLGISDYFVTTSFFNQHHTVQRIWLTQAGAIIVAHMLAVILSHVIALKAFGSHKLAVISQLPVAVFMLAYTVFGLWLLATPVAL